jgi:hypothetical protein
MEDELDELDPLIVFPFVFLVLIDHQLGLTM